jgi:acyl carrier protein
METTLTCAGSASEPEGIIMDELFEKVKALTAKNLDIDEDRITPEFSFRDVDSLNAYALLFALEEEFAIKIPDETAYEFETVGDAYAFIKKELT